MLNRLRAYEKRQDAHRLRRSLTNPKTHKGDCRRFVGGVSFDRDMFGLKVILARHIRFRQLFHYIQARGVTCALHVASDNLKARATLITLDGRGICCSFRRRGHKQATLGEGAFAELLMVLKEVDCTFNLSLLNNATANGMASTLYGQSNIRSMSRAPRRTFLMAIDDLKSTGGAGCVQVVKGKDEVIITAYVYKGEARTFVSGKHGTLESYQSAGKLLTSEHNDARCVTWRLNELDKLDEYAFDITNLRIVDYETFNDGEVFESTEQFLMPFFKKPTLMDTLLYDNCSPKEQHETDILYFNNETSRRSVTSFSHLINPFWGRM
ncbi:MAG: hypothetical protein K2X93_02480 [Candidatus Obscuribacterales bacterium]|nr:hypothetical protein [Candidatus Obscuribacterales bacterium]